MYEKFSEVSEYEELEEPSVLSTDPSERKLARRLHIQRRLEALTKQTGTEGEEVVEKTPIEKQILISTDLLEKLAVEGDEVVSCVRVANDARELERRQEEQKIRRSLLKRLEEEDKECTQKYREITEKWPTILASKDPLDIHAEMANQNAQCLEILSQKDTVIAELRRKLEEADLKFEADQKKQNEDIDLLLGRMENQVRTMVKAYRQELQLIEDVIESERKMFLETATEKWEVLFKKLQDDSQENVQKKKEIMREYEEAMKKAMIDHQEQFRSQKIKLELEIQRLQQEVQNIKAACLMNIEKLDYNYIVLKRREDENIIIKNQQKRRITKLQDIINDLRRNYTELEESTRNEIQMLTNQVLKAHKSILDLQEKSNHFTTVSDRKYMQIWNMNIESANELLDKVLQVNATLEKYPLTSFKFQILTADRIIYEQVLGSEWKAPELKLLKKEDLPSYRETKKDACAQKKEKVEDNKKKRISKPYKPATTLEEINLERRLLNHIITQISNQCDYLLEDNIQKLLSNYSESDKLVVRLDNVFRALDIKSEEELRFLLNFFLPYTYCPTCRDKTASTSSGERQSLKSTSSSKAEVNCSDVCGYKEELNAAEAKLIETVEDVIHGERLYDDNDIGDSNNFEQISLSETSPEDLRILTHVSNVIEDNNGDSEIKRQLSCDKGHLLEIETTFVSRALKEFVQRYEFVAENDSPSAFTEELQRGKVTASRNVTTKDITEFWKRYRDIFSDDREKLWDILLVGLKNYHGILKERHRLNKETESLRKQNIELQRLLRTYATEHDDSGIM